jgi:hypothetical protein
MEQSSFWESHSRSAGYEFHRFLCNLKAHYRVHKNPSWTLAEKVKRSPHPNTLAIKEIF